MLKGTAGLTLVALGWPGFAQCTRHHCSATHCTRSTRCGTPAAVAGKVQPCMHEHPGIRHSSFACSLCLVHMQQAWQHPPATTAGQHATRLHVPRAFKWQPPHVRTLARRCRPAAAWPAGRTGADLLCGASVRCGGGGNVACRWHLQPHPTFAGCDYRYGLRSSRQKECITSYQTYPTSCLRQSRMPWPAASAMVSPACGLRRQTVQRNATVCVRSIHARRTMVGAAGEGIQVQHSGSLHLHRLLSRPC